MQEIITYEFERNKELLTPLLLRTRTKYYSSLPRTASTELCFEEINFKDSICVLPEREHFLREQSDHGFKHVLYIEEELKLYMSDKRLDYDSIDKYLDPIRHEIERNSNYPVDKSELLHHIRKVINFLNERVRHIKGSQDDPRFYIVSEELVKIESYNRSPEHYHRSYEFQRFIYASKIRLYDEITYLEETYSRIEKDLVQEEPKQKPRITLEFRTGRDPGADSEQFQLFTKELVDQGLIPNISTSVLHQVFENKSIIINKIDWLPSSLAWLKLFVNALRAKRIIKDFKGDIWVTTSKCFLHRGRPINVKKLREAKDHKIALQYKKKIWKVIAHLKSDQFYN